MARRTLWLLPLVAWSVIFLARRATVFSMRYNHYTERINDARELLRDNACKEGRSGNEFINCDGARRTTRISPTTSALNDTLHIDVCELLLTTQCVDTIKNLGSGPMGTVLIVVMLAFAAFFGGFLFCILLPRLVYRQDAPSPTTYYVAPPPPPQAIDSPNIVFMETHTLPNAQQPRALRQRVSQATLPAPATASYWN